MRKVKEAAIKLRAETLMVAGFPIALARMTGEWRLWDLKYIGER
jgi:hypothetical protein